jgi:glycerate kinase
MQLSKILEKGDLMYKVVIAPDSFKGSLTAKEVCDAVEEGIMQVYKNIHIVKLPMADGGEGTLQSLVDCRDGKIIYKRVLDPLANEIEAAMGLLEDRTAVIEMASASGLPLVPIHKRNPLITTTYGTGQLIKHGLDLGIQKFIIGIGGSATVDGGAGMLQALGIKLLDSNNEEIGFGGGNLNNLDSINLSSMDSRLKECEFLVACDVTNPLTGENGAARIYGPQKGARGEMVETLEEGLMKFSHVVNKYLNKNCSDVPGAGAAGGLGFGLISFLNARLIRGIDIVINETKLEEHMKNADLIITGEGKLDSQTAFGKTPIGVSKLAKKYDIPVIALAGALGDDIDKLYNQGITSLFSISKAPTSLEYSMENAYSLISDTTERVFRIIKAIGL